MTGQMSDTLKYNDEEYVIAGIKGDMLFDPISAGITPYSSCTACWRGFTLYYEVLNDRLILQGILINIKDTPVPINEKSPIDGKDYFFDYLYENLEYTSDFSGKLLIAKDFIQELYVHMGFQAPTSYQTVIELTIEEGKIISTEDFSEKMEYWRKHEMTEEEEPEDIQKWIAEKFSRDY